MKNYISSVELTPEQARNAIRAHWGIESMHWTLDVSMREDACQIYRENAAENLAGLRHMALNTEGSPHDFPKAQPYLNRF